MAQILPAPNVVNLSLMILKTAVGHVRMGRYGDVLGRRDNARRATARKILTVKRSNAPSARQDGSVGRVALSPNR